MVEPTLSYRVSKYFEPLAGVRYNHLSGELRGPGVLPTPRMPNGHPGAGGIPSWAPTSACRWERNSASNFRGDIGGFGVGSDLTWQVFPYLDWRFAKWGSLQAGYRWLYMDYETGSGASRFKYDMLNQGRAARVHFPFLTARAGPKPMKEHALKVFRQPPARLNCAQSMVHAWREVVGDTALTVAELKPFGAGRSPGGLCGSLYAACLLAPTGRTS